MNKLEAEEFQRLSEMEKSNLYNPENCEVVKLVSDLISNLPYETQFFYQIQHLQKTLFSIGSNYAEGRGKGGLKEIIKFDAITRGSIIEAKAQYLLCNLSVPKELELILQLVTNDLQSTIRERKNQITAKISKKN